jgi:RNA polymerase sigma factor (sigma-70 family)
MLLRVASDERLVGHVRAGSEPAFEVLYDRHHRGILGFCRHMLGSVEEAEDALQHTFMAAYRDLVGSDKPIQLRPWLYTIARNRCYTILRARRERPLGEADEVPTENLSAEVERRQDLRDLLCDLSQLPEEQRAALVLAELGAVSHDEIGTVLDVPREKVKALVFQARTSLIASRKARDTSCQEIREQLSSLRGGALRRTTLRRHLRECAGCRAFRGAVVTQRRALAVVLPVLPTLGLKQSALVAAFGSGSAGSGAAAAAGGAAATALSTAGAGSGAAATLSSAAVGGGGALTAKALVAVALVGGASTAGVSGTPAKSPNHAPGLSAEPGPSPRADVGATITPAADVPGGDAGATGEHGIDNQGEPAAGRKAPTLTRTRAPRRRADAHGRAAAPGHPKLAPAPKVKHVTDTPRRNDAPAKPPKVKPNRPTQTRTPHTRRSRRSPWAGPVPSAPRLKPDTRIRNGMLAPNATATPTGPPAPSVVTGAPEDHHPGTKPK